MQGKGKGIVFPVLS